MWRCSSYDHCSCAYIRVQDQAANVEVFDLLDIAVVGVEVFGFRKMAADAVVGIL